MAYRLAERLCGVLGLAVACAIVTFVTPLQAQDSTSSRTLGVSRTMKWSFGGWTAAGFNQPLRTRVGHRYNRDLYMAALRASRPVIARGRFTASYVFDIFPTLVATENPNYRISNTIICTSARRCFRPTLVEWRTAYAPGIAPIGVQMNVAVAKPVHWVIHGSGGGVYFNHKIPDPRETRFNFTAAGGSGFEFHTPIGAFGVGWQIHHISNAGTGRVNPSMNTRMLYFGYRR